MILYGPPGTGKTTLARLLAVNARAAFEEASAVNAGRAEVREVIERAQHRRSTSGERTIFFLDEIHRFNKAQQDSLLPAVEEGLVLLVGATTENPYFEVNSALLSRCRVYELHALETEHVLALLRRSLGDERGITDAPRVDDAALDFLATRAGGDARTALSALELACDTVGPDGAVTLRVAEDALQRSAILYDKEGDRHYDLISAWIKATRGSDPDASLLYLAGMLEGGEDPRYVARRMIVLASEDIGNADPRALEVAVATAAAVEHVGMPEAALNLAQAAVYLALAPEVERLVQGPRPGARVGARERHPAPAGLPAERRLPGREEARPRPGLRLPARPPRGRVRAGADALRRGGREVPRADRARRGARAAGALGADPRRARARLTPVGQNQPPWKPRYDCPPRKSPPQLESFSPIDGARLGSVPTVTPAEVQSVVDDVAEVQPFWAQLPLADRARYMRRAGQAIIDQLDDLTTLLTREQGKPRAESYSMELVPTIDTLRWLAEAGAGHPRRRARADAGVPQAEALALHLRAARAWSA